MAKYVQYGAGYSTAEGWLNFDASPTLRFQNLPLIGEKLVRISGAPGRFPDDLQYGDVIAGLPVESGSARGVFASHVLEHLSLNDMRTALAESFRILAPGGIFRLIVPDLRSRAQAFVDAEGDPEASSRFMRDCWLGSEHRPRTAIGRLKTVFGNTAHLWMYDYPAMERELEKTGFTQVRRASFGDSEDPMFARVEDESRFVDGDYHEVAIEAVRPQ